MKGVSVEGVRVWRVREAVMNDVCIHRMSESIEWVEVFYSEM